MVPRAVWREIGGFDESFFPLWFEDVDFCRRAARRGYQFFYVPGGCCRTYGSALDFAVIGRETAKFIGMVVY